MDTGSYADAAIALRSFWMFIAAGFAIFFALCYWRVHSTMMALRYSAWLFVASAAVYGAVSFNNGGNLTIQSQADVNIQPKNVAISYQPPLTTITWDTDKAAAEYVIYQNDYHNDTIAFDQQQLTPTQNHHVIIKNLESQSVYPFRIKYATQEFKSADGKDLIIRVP